MDPEAARCIVQMMQSCSEDGEKMPLHLLVRMQATTAQSATEYFEEFFAARGGDDGRAIVMTFLKEAEKWCASHPDDKVKTLFTDVRALNAAVAQVRFGAWVGRRPVAIPPTLANAIIYALLGYFRMPPLPPPHQIVDNRLASLETENVKLRKHLQRLEATIEGLMRCRDVDAGKVDYRSEAGISTVSGVNEQASY